MRSYRTNYRKRWNVYAKVDKHASSALLMYVLTEAMAVTFKRGMEQLFQTRNTIAVPTMP